MVSSEYADAYTRSGVDYGAMDPAKITAQEYARYTAFLSPFGGREVVSSRGESAHIVSAGDFYVASLVEGLGTKALVADAMRIISGKTQYDSIGYSTAATILNDLATTGAHPVVAHAFWATGSSAWFEDKDRMGDLIKGWGDACIEVGAIWGGGESQAISGVVNPEAVVLAGSAWGIISPKDRYVDGQMLQKRDRILLAPSTGIHDNGLTLARKISDGLSEGYKTRLSDGEMYGNALLRPTRLYSPLVQELLNAGVGIHYIVNITGHGWRKLMRHNGNFSYVIENIPTPQPAFEFMQMQVNMSDDEMYGTYNMGAGYALMVPESQVEAAIGVSRKVKGCKLMDAGYIEEGEKEVHILPKGITFAGESLQLR